MNANVYADRKIVLIYETVYRCFFPLESHNNLIRLIRNSFAIHCSFLNPPVIVVKFFYWAVALRACFVRLNCQLFCYCFIYRIVITTPRNK